MYDDDCDPCDPRPNVIVEDANILGDLHQIKWYRYYNRTGVPKEHRLLDNYNTIELERSVVVQVWGENGRMFAVFPNPRILWIYLKSLPPNRRNHYESHRGGRRMISFDVDIDLTENPEVDGDAVVDELRRACKTVIERIWNRKPGLKDESAQESIIITGDDFMTFTSHGINSKGHMKYSAHPYVLGYHFRTNIDMKKFYLLVKDEMPNYSKWVDHAFYSRFQQIRLAGSSKYKEHHRSKKLLREWAFMGETFRARDDWYEDETGMPCWELFLASMSGEIDPLSTVLDYDQDNDIAGLDDNVVKIEELEMHKAYRKLLENLDRVCLQPSGKKFTIPPFGNPRIVEGTGLIILSRVKNHPYNPSSNWCVGCKRIHDNDNPHLSIGGINHSVYYHCRRGTGGVFLGNLLEDVLPQEHYDRLRELWGESCVLAGQIISGGPRKEIKEERKKVITSEEKKKEQLEKNKRALLEADDRPLYYDNVSTEETIHGETIHGETIHGETIHGETIHGETIHGETIHGEAIHGEAIDVCFPHSPVTTPGLPPSVVTEVPTQTGATYTPVTHPPERRAKRRTYVYTGEVDLDHTQDVEVIFEDAIVKKPANKLNFFSAALSGITMTSIGEEHHEVDRRTLAKGPKLCDPKRGRFRGKSSSVDDS